MPKNLFPLDDTKSFSNQKHVGHNRWHPDIPANVTVKPGDVFRPLGMQRKRKKVQDYFTDIKLPLFEKEKVWILDISGQIAWIVGHRLDEMFKMRSDSTLCWHIKFEKE